jgi:hypothetical protein
MAKTGIQNYVNTVIFCVVMKIIAIIILGAILMGYVNDKIAYFLITIEVCIVVIVAAALISIANYEKRLAEETKNILKAKMNLVTCPDFHTQTSKNMCLSNYITPDGRYTYTFMSGSNVSLQEYLNKPVTEACDQMHNDVTFLDTNNTLTYLYPWTDLVSKCDVL